MGDRSQGAGEDGVNVQVLLRCRPLSDKEIVDRVPQVITCNETLREVTLFQNTGGKTMSRTFRFDKVFGCDSTQEKLFKGAIVPIVHEVMDGFNCTIFAYGQTGTGKTYTMEGGPRESDDGRKLSAQAGVIPRSIKQIFDHIEASNIDSTVKVSFLELYNEELTDLLIMDDGQKLRLLEDKAGVVVQGLEEVIVRTAAEIYQVLDRGTAKRRTASTLLNQRSSRSHSIFTITIHMKETTAEGEDVIKIGKLNLVDLAGSENISRSGAKDNRAREAGSINQSLLTLGRVITALVEHSGHVPYRDSKLTRLLRDSLGGRTKTCIIATIAPTVQCQDETISTLDYAHRAKNIRNRPELNQKISKTTMIKELAAEIERLKLDLVCTREKNGVYLSSERYEQGELERVQLREVVKVMKSEFEALETSSTTQLEALQAALDMKTSQLAATQQELQQAHNTIQERAFVTASLRRAEQSLAGFAEKLLDELQQCNQDIHGLTEHLAQGATLHAADRQCLKELQGVVGSRISSLTSSLSSALSSQSAHLQAISEDVASFTQQKDQDIATLRQQLASIQSSVTGLQVAATEQLAAVSASAGTGFQSVLSKARSMQSATEDATKAAVSAADAAVSALLGALQSQSQALEGMIKLNTQEAEAAAGLLTRYQEAARNGLQGVVSAAQGAARSEEARLKEVQGMMAGFTASFNASMQQQQVELMTRLKELVDGFTAERCTALGTGISALSHAVAKASGQAVNQANSLAGAASDTLTQLKDLEGSVSSQLSASQTKLASSASTCHGALRQAGEGGSAAYQQARQQLQAGIASIGSHVQAMCTEASSAQESTSQVHTSGAAKLSSATHQLGSMASHVIQAVDEQHNEAVVFAGALSRQAEDAAQALQGFGSSQESSLQALAACVSQGVGAALALPIPEAPTARQRPGVPPLSTVHDLMCPGEPILLAQLRNTTKEVLKRGGDARQAASLLLTPGASLTPRNLPHAPDSPLTNENLGPAPGSPTAQPGTAGQVRSKIPAGPTAQGKMMQGEGVTPEQRGAGLGLSDRTNL